MAKIVQKYQDFIFEFVKTAHLQQMPADVKKRFDQYSQNADFVGNMKNWNAEKDREIEFDVAVADAEYKKAYKAFLAVFESMRENESSLDKKVKEEILDKVFGTNKVFDNPKPILGVENELDNFRTQVLDAPGNETRLTNLFKDYTYGGYVSQFFDDGKFDFKTFRNGIANKKYESDPKLRKQVLAVMDFFRSYESDPILQPILNAQLGSSLNKYKFNTNGLPDNTAEWFQSAYNPGFKALLPQLLTSLVTNKKFREEFSKYDSGGSGAISKNVTKGLEKTAYDDSKSDDFIPPLHADQKSFGERFKDQLNNIWDSNLRQWTDILRGTRRYFSPYSTAIIKALDKVKTKDGKRIKPTDGIKGILENKEAILKQLDGTSPKAKKHFEWFTKQMETYSKTMPKAYDGALRNPYKMRRLVSQMIADAIQDGKKDEAKTAMEILSTMKYGIMHSRTVDALREADFTVLSDDKLSWNKYEGIQFVTKALDKTAKFALVATGRIVAAIHNKWMRDHTKLKGKLRDSGGAHKQWKRNNDPNSLNQPISDIDNSLVTANGQLSAAETAMHNNHFADRASLESFINNTINYRDNTLKPDLDAKRANLETENNKLTAENQKFNDLKTKQADLKQKRAAQRADLANLNKTLTRLNTKLAATTDPDDQKRYKDAIFQKQQEIDDLRAAMKDVASESFRVNRSLTTQKQAVANQQKVVDNIQKTIDRRQNSLDRVNDRIHDRQGLLKDYDDAAQTVQSLNDQKNDLLNQQTNWKDNHPDEYVELMGYWDMLESFGKSHQFTLASHRMRKKFLKDYNNNNSKAQHTEALFIDKYERRYAA